MKIYQDNQNFFNKHAVKTITLLLLIFFILLFAGFEKCLSYYEGLNNIVNIEGVKRYIRLRENPPLMINIDTVKLSDSEQGIFKFRIDENGFIQPSKIYNDPDMNLFFIGGSTTECSAVNEENRFPYLAGRLLDKKLNMKINSFNSGVAGNNSMHSINILLNKIIPLKPNVVVMMHNINDMAILWHEDTYWNHSRGRSLIVQQVPPSIFNVLMDSTIKKMIPHVYTKIESIVNRVVMKYYPGKFDEFAGVRDKHKTLDKKYGEELFRQNLETFIAICRIRGTLPVLMTQENLLKTNPDKSVKKQVEQYGIDYYDFKEIYDAFNEAVKEVGRNAGILVIDLAKEIPQDERYMSDFVHFNDAGSKLAAEIITRELANHLEQSQESH